MKKGENRETRGNPCSGGGLDTVPGETETPSPEGKGAGEANIPSSHGKKRAASKNREGKSPKRGRMPSSGGSGLASDVAVQLHHKDMPPGKS